MAAIGLPNTLLKDLRDVFAECKEFENNDRLMSVFAVGQLESFRRNLPIQNTSTLTGRVQDCLNYLLEERIKGGPYAIQIFVRTLRDKYAPENDLHDRLNVLYEAINKEVPVSFATPDQHGDSESSAEVQKSLATLAQKIANTFDEESIESIIFEIELDSEEVRGHSSLGKSQELVAMCCRQSLIPKLLATCQTHDRSFNWTETKALAQARKSADRATTQIGVLTRLIFNSFNNDEFQILCFDLDVDQDTLIGGSRYNQIRTLVSALKGVGQLNHLIKYCTRKRPEERWPKRIPSVASKTNKHLLSERQIFRQALRETLCQRFSLTDLRELCFLAGAIPNFFVEAPATPKSLFAAELINHFESEGLMGGLIAEIIRLRPDADWQTNVSQPSRSDLKSGGISPERQYLIQLYTYLIEGFRFHDLINISLQLNLDYRFFDQKDAETKTIFALRLIWYCHQQNKLPRLVDLAHKINPNAKLTEAFFLAHS
jgi:Effector-associated domain 7